MSSKEDAAQAAEGSAAIIDHARNGIARTMASPGAKFILIGFITFSLLIPAMMVWGLVEERSRRATEVATEISRGWGASQLINGPYLVIPYEVDYGKEDEPKIQTKHAFISPETLEIEGDINVTERKKSIYKTQLYHLKTRMAGSFKQLDLRRIYDRGGKPKLGKAFLVMGMSDVTGFRSDIGISIKKETRVNFLPGLNHMNNTIRPYQKNISSRHAKGGGVHLPLKQSTIASGFDFEIDMALNGSQNLSFMPAGKTTKLDVKSNWPHPGFNGRFLPEARDIKEDGFSASWTVPNLARGIEPIILTTTLPASETLMQMSFVEPLKFYQVTARTLKYSIAFFSLAFLAIFILELSGRQLVHWIQYMLVGFALMIFYILLLALAEQVGFSMAYLLSSAATTILITWYIGDTLGSRAGSYVIFSVLSVMYLIMYLILNEEQFALLAGSIIAFLAIAATMITTRKVNWSQTQEQQTLA